MRPARFALLSRSPGDIWLRLRLRYPLRKRYQAVIIGRESGTVTVLPFIRFRRWDQCAAWCVTMNAEFPGDGLAYYEVQRIPPEAGR